jgi:hypothetical protein
VFNIAVSAWSSLTIGDGILSTVDQEAEERGSELDRKIGLLSVKSKQRGDVHVSAYPHK